MHFIGITGGVGAGKSEILKTLSKLPNTRIIQADDLAKELMQPGHALHDRIAEEFASDGVLDENGQLRTDVMADVIFSDDKKRKRANAIIHPEVKKEIMRQVDKERADGKCELFFLEAALLLEEHYDEICDEIWYIYASEKTRRKRLASQRGYSEEKMDAIMASQLKEEVFRSKCQEIIDNDGKHLTAREQVLDCVARLQAKRGMR